MTEAPAAPAPPAKPARHDLPWLRPILLLCVFGLYLGNALCTSVEWKLGNDINLPLALTGAGLLLLIYFHYARGLSRKGFVAWMVVPALLLAGVTMFPRGFPSIGWNSHPLAGRWIILGALAAGTAGALVYLIDAAVRRVRLPLGAWLILLCAHAAGMVLVSRYFAWRAGVEGAGAAVWSVDLALLALALAVLLLRAGVVAARSAEWWPAWLVHASGPEANVARGTPLRFPRLPVVLLYACSPLLWWLVGIQLLESTLRGAPSAGGATLFAVAWGGLCLRASFAAGAIYGSEYALRKARKEGDSVWKAAAEAFLFRNGLAWAGLMGLYGFVFAAQRVQENELARVLQATEAPLVAEMRAMQPPACTPRANAANWYQQAAVALPVVPDHSIFDEAWQTPDAVQFVRSSSQSLSLLAAGQACSSAQWYSDYGAPVGDLQKLPMQFSDARNLVQLQLLEARHAGLDRDWNTLLGNVHQALVMARHLELCPETLACLIGIGLEEDAVLALLPALLWHPEGPAGDSHLAEAERMLDEYEKGRGQLLAESVRWYTLMSLRILNQKQAAKVDAWPGGNDAASLSRTQPLTVWTDRTVFIEWQGRLYDFLHLPASEPGFEQMREQMDALHVGDFYCLLPHYCFSDWHVHAALRMGRAALAATRYKLAHGVWPSDLALCVPDFLEAVPEDACGSGGKLRIALDPPRIWYGPPSFDPGEHLRFDREKDGLKAFGPREHFDGTFFLEPPRPAYGEVEGWKYYDQCEIGSEQKALKDPAAAVWKEAARHLATMGTEAWNARGAFFAMAGEPDPERRMWAAFLLGTMSHTEDPVGAHLERLAKDTDPDVARVARWSQLWLRTLARREAEAQKNAAPKDATAEPLKE